MTALPIRQVSARLVERITEAPIGKPIELSITIDEDWSPRIQGELTAPRKLLDELERPGGSTTLGKWQGDYLTIELEIKYGRGRPVSEYTAAMLQGRPQLMALIRSKPAPWHPGEPLQPLSYATTLWGGSVAAVTAAVGGSIAKLTAALRQPGGSYDIPPTERRLVRVRRRKETPTDLEGIVTITLAGEDVRLHDYRHTGTTAFVNLYTSLRQLITDVLGKISAVIFDVYSVQLLGGADVLIEAGQEWKPAQTAWEFLHPILASVGWQLYADTDGIYRLEPRTSMSAPHGLDADRDLIDFQAIRDRASAYFDAAMIEYTDGDPLTPAERWDIYADPGAQRIAHETRPGKRTIAGAAEKLVERSRGRTTPGNAQATVQLDLLPGQRPAWRTPWRTEHATIASLTHTFPAARLASSYATSPPTKDNSCPKTSKVFTSSPKPTPNPRSPN